MSITKQQYNIFQKIHGNDDGDDEIGDDDGFS